MTRAGVAHADQRASAPGCAPASSRSAGQHLGLAAGRRQLERLVPADATTARPRSISSSREAQAERGQHLGLLVGSGADVAADERVVGLELVERSGGESAWRTWGSSRRVTGVDVRSTAVAVPPAVTEPESFTGAPPGGDGRLSPSVSPASRQGAGRAAFQRCLRLRFVGLRDSGGGCSFGAPRLGRIGGTLPQAMIGLSCGRQPSRGPGFRRPQSGSVGRRCSSVGLDLLDLGSSAVSLAACSSPCLAMARHDGGAGRADEGRPVLDDPVLGLGRSLGRCPGSGASPSGR